MKILIKPNELEEQYQAVESYCWTKDECSNCSGESVNNSAPDSEDDILF